MKHISESVFSHLAIPPHQYRCPSGALTRHLRILGGSIFANSRTALRVSNAPRPRRRALTLHVFTTGGTFDALRRLGGLGNISGLGFRSSVSWECRCGGSPEGEDNGSGFEDLHGVVFLVLVSLSFLFRWKCTIC